MERRDIDDLLERTFSGGPPAPGFRAEVLRDSVEALAFARQRRRRWQWARSGMAAGFIAIASFAFGRWSASPELPQSAPAPVVADVPETVAVSNELVAWLDAARLFRQLGMEDRMARAVDRASMLLPQGSALADGGAAPAFAGDGAVEGHREILEPMDATMAPPSDGSTNRILAQLLGD